MQSVSFEAVFLKRSIWIGNKFLGGVNLIRESPVTTCYQYMIKFNNVMAEFEDCLEEVSNFWSILPNQHIKEMESPWIVS